jgi:hypothetical protein
MGGAGGDFREQHEQIQFLLPFDSAIAPMWCASASRSTALRRRAISLHDGLIAARRHGESRNRSHRQTELVRDELAPRLDLDAICL